MRCEEARSRILEQTLEGTLVPAGPLAEHLRGCAGCRAFLARLGEVDGALRTLPVESAPAQVARQVMVRVATAGRQPTSFLPWTLWLPVLSLLVGLFWAYVTLVWPNGVALLRSVDPTVAQWLIRFEEWVVGQQAMLSAVTLSVGAGLLVTLLAVGLGLYVGRSRVATSHGHGG